MTPKIVTVVGARPQFVKAAAVSRAVAASGRLEEVLVHTGQHYDENMSDVFFRELGIAPPRHQLAVGSASHGRQTALALEGIEQVLMAERPDMVLLYGDTNSTLAGALAAAKLVVPIAHVEAGVRSFDRSMPEEVNRVVTDQLSTLLLCPTATAVGNLAREGITAGVSVVGDVMFDVFLHAAATAPEFGRLAETFSIADGKFAIVTLHRPANTDDAVRFSRIVEGLAAVARDGVTLLWPVHPRLRSSILDRLDGKVPANVRLVEPVSYLEMNTLLRHSRCVFTDSGGLQKETLWAGRPCITMRPDTEWVETVDLGWNVLVDDNPEAIVAASRLGAPSAVVPDVFGDGHAAERIVDAVADHLGAA
jgi:UDP-GlcNAc3NAcA epimerase